MGTISVPQSITVTNAGTLPFSSVVLPFPPSHHFLNTTQISNPANYA